MRLRTIPCAAIIAFMLLICLGPVQAQESLDKKRPVKIDGMKVLPLRVLARPFSNVYQDKDEAGAKVMENVTAFQPFYVYAKPTPEDRELGLGWYEVGTDNRGKVIGWMKADDVFEWKQTMCLAYTHPQGRKPVLMFESKKELSELVGAEDQARQDQANQFYQAIESKQIPDKFPIKSVEPKKAIDISEEFYLLPILDFESLEMAGREGRLVRLAAVTGAVADAREKTDIRENEDDLDAANEDALDAPADVLKKLAVDVVFVMDTTVSMRPFIDSTKDVIKTVVKEISAKADVNQGIKFGIWGYRDSVDDIPGIGYTTKNYTPELQMVDDFLATLDGVEVTPVDSVDFEEDVFSGIDDGLQKTAWTDGAVRIMVLVGDAPAHEAGHKWNLSLQNENTLRAYADDTGIFLMALHVKNPKAAKYNDLAQTQFEVLATNQGAPDPVYHPVPADQQEAYTEASNKLTRYINSMVAFAKEGQVDPGLDDPPDLGQDEGDDQDSPPPDGDDPVAGGDDAASGGGEQAAIGGDDAASGGDIASSGGDDVDTAGDDAATGGDDAAGGDEVSGDIGGDDEEPTLDDKIKGMLRAALVRWVGTQTGAKAPRDIIAWAVDKDLIDPTIQSLEVRLLINKRQLDSLKTVLSDVMAAGRRGQIGGEDFFDALQATAATAARDPNQIKNARTMAQTGLIPEFLLNLPYKSQLMDMTNDLWTNWSMDEQDEFLDQLDAKVKAYQAFHDDPDLWIDLNQGDEPDDHVYPISLELLP